MPAFSKNILEHKRPTKTYPEPKPDCFAHRDCSSAANRTVCESIPSKSCLQRKTFSYFHARKQIKIFFFNLFQRGDLLAFLHKQKQ